MSLVRRPVSRGLFRALLPAVGLLASGIGGGTLAAQLRVDNVRVNAGAALERYTGNFSVVNNPVVD